MVADFDEGRHGLPFTGDERLPVDQSEGELQDIFGRRLGEHDAGVHSLVGVMGGLIFRGGGLAPKHAVGDLPARALVRIPSAHRRGFRRDGLQFTRLAEIIGEDRLIRDEQPRFQVRGEDGEGEEGQEQGAHRFILLIHRGGPGVAAACRKAPDFSGAPAKWGD